jgi:hypothetical protein
MIVRLPLRRQRRRAVRFFYRRSDTSKESRAQAIPRRNSSEFLLCRAMAGSVSISFSTREATACLSEDATMAARKAACAAMSWPSMKLIRSTSASYAPATCDACAASFSPSAAKRPSKSSIRILIGDWCRNADSKRGTTLAANTPGPSQTPSIFRWSGECREPSPHLATWQTASRLLPSGSVTNAA